MNPIIARNVLDPSTYSDVCEIVELTFSPSTVRIQVSFPDIGKLVKVQFESVFGFRVLDEGDLLEFWPTCNLNNGWLYEVTDNGWFELESKRDGFIMGDRTDLKEYLVVGLNECASILSYQSPRIESKSAT